jgi:hypothetical protein
MKKSLIVALSLVFASVLVMQAQDAKPAEKAPAPKKELTAEQQKIMADMKEKYDTNKDGKLDKTEKAAMSQEDKDAMVKAGLSKAPKKPAADAAPAAPEKK